MSLTQEEIKNLFMNQIDCGSVVAGEFSNEVGLSKEVLRKACGCMGGGMFCGETCGAIAAGNVVIGLKYGISEEGDEAGKVEAIKKISEFNEKMHANHDSFLCRDILGCSVPEAAESGKMMTFCPALCEEVINTLNEIL